MKYEEFSFVSAGGFASACGDDLGDDASVARMRLAGGDSPRTAAMRA